MDFPLDDLLDEERSYQWLLDFFHDGELHSPYSHSKNYIINDSRRAPVIQYKDKTTSQYFTVFTTTVFSKTHFSCAQVVLIIRGFLQGVSTAQLARELSCDYQNLLELRHAFMARGVANLNRSVLADEVTETDEMFQNAGEKGERHLVAADPPRRRGNKKKAMAPITTTDRPSLAPLAGAVEECE